MKDWNWNIKLIPYHTHILLYQQQKNIFMKFSNKQQHHKFPAMTSSNLKTWNIHTMHMQPRFPPSSFSASFPAKRDLCLKLASRTAAAKFNKCHSRTWKGPIIAVRRPTHIRQTAIFLRHYGDLFTFTSDPKIFRSCRGSLVALGFNFFFFRKICENLRPWGSWNISSPCEVCLMEARVLVSLWTYEIGFLCIFFLDIVWWHFRLNFFTYSDNWIIYNL